MQRMEVSEGYHGQAEVPPSRAHTRGFLQAAGGSWKTTSGLSPGALSSKANGVERTACVSCVPPLLSSHVPERLHSSDLLSLT